MLRSELTRALDARRDNDVAIVVPLTSGRRMHVDIERVRYDASLDSLQIVTEAYDDSPDLDEAGGLDIDAIRARADAATDGPWATGQGDGSMLHLHEVVVSLTDPILEFEDSEEGRANAEFVAHARTDVPALLAHIELLNSTLHAVLKGAENDYRQCIVSARATKDGGHYEKCNGRAEAYRQAATRLAEKTGLPVPDWDRIRREVPADGVYRVR